MNLQMRALDGLTFYNYNCRVHDTAQIEQLMASIKEFGFTSPVLIDESDTIIAGAGRVRAARALSMVEVPCIVLTGLTDAQKAAYVIADNKIALNSEWDLELLNAELEKLSSLNFDINLTGFTELEAAHLAHELAEALASIEDGLVPPKTNWSGMPEFDQPDDSPFRTILVHMNDQAAVDALAVALGANITNKTKYVWFPKQKKKTALEVVYA